MGNRSHELISSPLRDAATIGVIAAISFIPWLGRLHLFDWDEINFAEAAREMVLTGNYRDVQIGFQPFTEKPPLFMWIQALSMRLFGVGEFAARLPNALVGIFTLVGIYVLGRQLFDRRFALWWVLAFGGSLLPNMYFRSGIIDPLFNLLIFTGIVALFAFQRQRQKPQRAHAVWAILVIAGISVGLAVLTKGPVGVLLPGLTWIAVWVVRRKSMTLPIIPLLIWVTVAGLVAAPWYVAAQHGTVGSTGGFISGFIARQLELLRTGVAGHTGPWYFHFIVLALGCFPASVFAISALSGRTVDDSPTQRDFRLWMIWLLIIVVGVFSLVQTKIVHYSSLAYFPISFFAAQALTDVEKAWWPRYWQIAIGAIALIWVALFLALPVAGLMIAHNDVNLMGVRDPFARATLANPVGWFPMDLVVGGTYLLGVAFALAALSPKNPTRFAASLFVATGIIVPLALVRFAPKVERYAQGTPIAFYESLRGCQCYVAALGYKTYADLFYARVPPERLARAAAVGHDRFEEWLLSGPIDRPAYFVSKIDKADRWRGQPGLEVIDQRNGFVFFRRIPQ